MNKFYPCLFLLCSVICFGQNPADRDPTFNMFEQPLNQYFIDANVIKTVVLPDGKIMVLDENSKLVKLDNNLLDNSFQLQAMTAGSNGSLYIDDFCVLPDGKVVIVGIFGTYAGQVSRDIARLLPDGSLDTSFNYPGNLDRISQVVAKLDGTLYITADDAEIFRLNANGTNDAIFAESTAIQYGKFALQPDGKLLVFHSVAGNFNNGIHKLSRLNENGTVDATFTTSTYKIGVNGQPDLNALVVQQDGKILVGGHFKTCNSIVMSGIARLNADGSLDTGFDSGTGFFESLEFGASSDQVFQIVEQPDHKLLVGGYFLSYNNIPKKHIIRLNPDATIDETFLAPDAFINIDRVKSIALTAQNSIFVGGNHGFGISYDSYMVKLLPNGTKDTSYSNIRKGFYWPGVLDAFETQDGKILAVGNFHTYNDQLVHNFIRLTADGLPDPTLTYGGLSGFVGPETANPQHVAERPDGKIYIAGEFESYNGAPARSIILINPDGTRDMSFNADEGLDYEEFNPGGIDDILVTPDGGVIVTGGFENVDAGSVHIGCSGFVKYSPTGTVSWIPAEITAGATGVKYQADGKLLVGTSGFGNTVCLYRFNSGATTIDNTFVLNASIASGSVSSLDIQPDGKILVHGTFTIAGIVKNLARINADGSLDTTFNCPLDTSAAIIDSFKLLADGKIMISYRLGEFLNGPMCRLNNDGSLDTTFEQQPDLAGIDFLSLSTGKLLLYGYIQSYQNQHAFGMIRLMGEDYNFIQGQNRLDANQDGCDVSDSLFANVKYTVSGGSGDFDFICNTTGNYLIGMTEGAYDVTPKFENPEYFTASPPSITVNFPSQQSPLTQQFCITPVGVHPDLETMLIPLSDARPGFDATYQLVFKNKGNQELSGTLGLVFDDASTDLVSANPAPVGSSGNSLAWNFSSLLPYETRSVLLKFNLNSPTETPPLSSGSVLQFTASASLEEATDDTPQDNIFNFNQTVVNSYDPNDKTCLQGSAISASQVGDYVHYVIRFENNGTASAKNITVRDVIDISKYDINSLVPMLGSHLFTTRIVNVNQVEFFFEDINLSYADVTNDGFVSFKIKTKSSLVIGDSISNSAAIYFDYNFPVITNTAITTVQALSSQDFENPYEITLYPNPSSDVLHIGNPANINISSIRIYNMAGQLLFVRPNAIDIGTIDISNLSAGSYLAVFTSATGNLSIKFIKK